MHTTRPDDLVGGVDVHAHWFGTDLTVESPYDDPRWPRLVLDSPATGRILLGDRPFRDVRASLWDVEARIADLDRAGLAVQLISPVPIALAYWAERGPAVRYARAVNDSVARAVQASSGRLEGIGTLPLPHVADAVVELEALMTGPAPLRGVEVGARIGRWELDDPGLLPVFEAAEALGALLFIHPLDGGGGSVRRSGQPYDFGLGMHVDTALAATALVFGGVLERFPRLQVVLAHGCGGYAWTYPRLRLAAELFGSVPAGRLDELTASLYVDSLVLDPEHLRLLEHRFGPSRVVLGTDHPFFPEVTSGARAFLRGAEASGGLDRGGAARVFAANGRALLDERLVVA